jgi:hypothetical protein
MEKNKEASRRNSGGITQLDYRRKGDDKMLRTRSLKLITGFGITLCLALVGMAVGGSSDSHVVTVSFAAISGIALPINAAYAGTGWENQVDDSISKLHWTATGTSKKITVSADLVPGDYTLKVLAQNVSGGTAASEVTLDDTDAHDFVTMIVDTTGGCDIQYIGSAPASAETSSYKYTVIYTLTEF